jgi:DNA-binding transcriptional MerR regulator
MFSIGEFARHGRVSVRMLRHYDAIGLLRPACVDPASGYRFYQASQLAELNRVIALKDLGFTLQQVQAIIDERVSAAELRGMLKLRRAEIHAQLEAETTRLARVEARLLTIEDEARSPADGVVLKRLAPVRVGELTGVAAVPVLAGSGEDHGFSVVELAEVDRAAAIIHHGSMDDVLSTGQALARWIDANGYRSAGYAREVTLEWSADPDQWVTELQQPIYATGG